jgi:hypothetical protein
MVNPIYEMFEDDNGGTSSMRFVFIACVLIIFFVWAFLCIKNNMLYSFEMKDLGVIGVLIGGKEVQKFLEGKELKNSQIDCGKKNT